jgi:hypothetical protein
MDVLFFVSFFREGFFFFIVTSMSLFCLILEYYLKYQAMIDDFFCKHVYILEGFFFFLKLEPRLKDFINLNENKKKRVSNSGLFFVKPFLHWGHLELEMKLNFWDKIARNSRYHPSIHPYMHIREAGAETCTHAWGAKMVNLEAYHVLLINY